MPFEQFGLLRDGHLNRREIVRVFVRRESHRLSRVPGPQQFDLRQLQELVRRRIDRHAMHDGKLDASMFEKAHQRIDFLQIESTG